MLYFSHLMSCFLRPWICQCFAQKPTVVVYGIDLSRHHSVRRVPALGLKCVSAFVFLRRLTLDSNTRQLPSHCPLFNRSLPLLRSKCHRLTTRPALALDTPRQGHSRPQGLKTRRPTSYECAASRTRRPTSRTSRAVSRRMGHTGDARPTFYPPSLPSFSPSGTCRWQDSRPPSYIFSATPS